jgi:VIT1/CCC1 family predicted Fe2+/Mn2+ transporter
MNRLVEVLRRDQQLALVMGVCDGILLALTLLAGRLLDGGGADLGLAIRVAVASLASGGFVFFVARYAELREELVRSGMQLNLPADRLLARTRLGRAVLRRAFAQAAIAGGSSFVGALLPMTVACLLPGPTWLALAVPVALLGILGAVLARVTRGVPATWAVGLVAGGIVISGIGATLRLV